jgi:hypothetical protein
LLRCLRRLELASNLANQVNQANNSSRHEFGVEKTLIVGNADPADMADFRGSLRSPASDEGSGASLVFECGIQDAVSPLLAERPAWCLLARAGSDPRKSLGDPRRSAFAPDQLKTRTGRFAKFA